LELDDKSDAEMSHLTSEAEEDYVHDHVDDKAEVEPTVKEAVVQGNVTDIQDDGPEKGTEEKTNPRKVQDQDNITLPIASRNVNRTGSPTSLENASANATELARPDSISEGKAQQKPRQFTQTNLKDQWVLPKQSPKRDESRKNRRIDSPPKKSSRMKASNYFSVLEEHDIPDANMTDADDRAHACPESESEYSADEESTHSDQTSTKKKRSRPAKILSLKPSAGPQAPRLKSILRNNKGNGQTELPVRNQQERIQSPVKHHKSSHLGQYKSQPNDDEGKKE
jgi:hypothetical protein